MKLDYLDWNRILATHFFCKSGLTVYLNANEELIKSLGRAHSAGVADLVEASKIGPPWVTQSDGFCQKAIDCMRDWRERKLELPPYIGYLVVFVLAEATKKEFGPLAYYKPLRKLLAESAESSAAYPSFSETKELWLDLERWSKTDRA